MTKPTIAVIGLNGVLGKPFIDALQSDAFADKVSFPVKAVTRSTKASSEKIQYVKGSVDPKDADSLSSELKGVDVVIGLTGANPDLLKGLEKVVENVKPKLVIPSQFGVEIDKADKIFPGFLGLKQAHSEALRKLGSKVVDIVTSFFAAPNSFLYEIVVQVGVNPSAGEVIYRGSPDQKLSIARVEDIGYAIASVATKNPSELPNKVRIQSEVVTQQDIVKRFEEIHNVKLSVKHESAEEALKKGQEKYAQGFEFKDFLYYLSVLASQGLDKGVYFKENENELVNPGQKLWKWTKY